MSNIMIWLILLSFVLHQSAFVFSASLTTEASTEYYDDYEYSDEYTETETEVETKVQIPRSRVIFEDDEFEEERDSNAINFRVSDEKSNLSKKIFFINPENRLSKIEMTLQEINDIFDKKKHTKKNKGTLPRQDKKTARGCRKKKLLFSTADKKCHDPTSAGPCKNNKWFVSVKGQLQGVCRKNQCTSDDNPIFFNGTCSALYGSCPAASRLYLNKRGVGFCDCDEGFSYNIQDDKCYKEHTHGPCTDDQTWLRRRAPKNHKTGHKVFGKCKRNKCKEGKVEWKDKKCYKVDSGDMFDMCAENERGEMVIGDEVMTCMMVMEGRAVAMGIGRSCRRGRAWSSYRNRCVRAYFRG